jgi:type IV secretory pathway VirB10-like protein
LDESFDDITSLLPGVDMSSDILNTSLPDIAKEMPLTYEISNPTQNNNVVSNTDPQADPEHDTHPEPQEQQPIQSNNNAQQLQQQQQYSKSVKLSQSLQNQSKKQNHQSPSIPASEHATSQPDSFEETASVGFKGGCNSFKLGDVKFSHHLRQINQKINAATTSPSGLAPPTAGAPATASATIDDDGFVAPQGTAPAHPHPHTLPHTDKGLITLQYLQFDDQKHSDLCRRAKRILPSHHNSANSGL